MEYRTRARVRMVAGLSSAAPVFLSRSMGWPEFAGAIEEVGASLSVLFAMVG